VKGETELKERQEFQDFARELTSAQGRLAGFFDAVQPVSIARAPGRLDVMGGIGDYSGSLVLELPIREATFVAAQLHPEPIVRAASVTAGASGPIREASFPLVQIIGPDGGGLTYEAAHKVFGARPADAWAAYAIGTLIAAAREGWIHLFRESGLRLLIVSNVPQGSGVSSSAAIEVASLFAISAASISARRGVELPNLEAALLCQRVENLIVGAPCGVMDQMSSAYGRRGQLLELLCQPASILGSVPLPEDLEFFGIDSGVQQAVTGTDYAQVRVGAFMGYRMLLESAGIKVRAGRVPGQLFAEDDRWQGYLANVTPSELDGEFAVVLPDFMSGSEFLACYGGTTDSVTRVKADIQYPVRAATSHPVHEHQRARLFSELLKANPSERRNVLLGELMYQSHASYSACGLGSSATDLLVRLVRHLGSGAGLYGAKITGGGSGGTVAVLARKGASSHVHAVAKQYATESGRGARVFQGSSAGAEEFGTLTVSGASFSS
jgi:L-arabinokinase